jgi:hypothetical protein
LKQCRNGWCERELLLFSDMFVYAQLKNGKYTAPGSYLTLCLRVVPRTYGGASCLDIHSPNKSFVLQFSTLDDRDAWATAFLETIQNARAKQQVPLYKEAPILVPNSLANECFQCKAQLTFFRRKHHCRACGSVFCSSCLSKKVYINSVFNHEPCKVCQTCWETIQKEKQDQAEADKNRDDDSEKIEADFLAEDIQGSLSDSTSESDQVTEMNP